jgi:hypothetical protein
MWSELLPKLFTRWFDNWKVYKELALTFSCILMMGILNYLYILLFEQPFTTLQNELRTAFEIVSVTLVSGMIPLLILTMFNFLRLDRKIKKSESISLRNNEMQGPISGLSINEGNEVFKLDLQKVFLIESMGNYIKIYQTPGDTSSVSIKRITMKRIEELLQGQELFIRVHRSFIVNASQILGIHKSATGDLSLVVPYKGLMVPVSRNKRKQINDLKLQD